MLIEYCEACGYLIPEADIAAGKHVKDAEGRLYCAKCAPQVKSARPTTPAVNPRHLGNTPLGNPAARIGRGTPHTGNRATGGHKRPVPTASAPAAASTSAGAAKKPIPWLVIAGFGAPVLVALAAGMMLLFTAPAAPVIKPSGEKVSTTAPVVINLPSPVKPTTPATPVAAQATPTQPPTQPEERVQGGGGLFAELAAERERGRQQEAQAAVQADKDLAALRTKLEGATQTPTEKFQVLQDFAEAHPNTLARREALRMAAAYAVHGAAENEFNDPKDWAKAEDLLALIDPAKHAVRGSWSRNGTVLSVQKDEYARIIVPYAPPPEYDVRAVGVRKVGLDNVAVYFECNGMTADFCVGADKNSILGFNDIDGENCLKNKSKRKSADLIKNNTPFAILLEVRKERVTAFLNGKKVTEWVPSMGKFTTRTEHALKWGAPMGLSAFLGVVDFYSFELADRTPPGLQPGLWWEYYNGGALTSAQNFCTAQAMPTTVQEWEKAAPQPGMNEDDFTVKVSGFIRLSEDAKYEFEYISDDKGHLEINGEKFDCEWNRPALTTQALKKGDNPIFISVKEERVDARLKFRYRVPGQGEFQPLPAEWLWHDPAKATRK